MPSLVGGGVKEQAGQVGKASLARKRSGRENGVASLPLLQTCINVIRLISIIV